MCFNDSIAPTNHYLDKIVADTKMYPFESKFHKLNGFFSITQLEFSKNQKGNNFALPPPCLFTINQIVNF